MLLFGRRFATRRKDRKMRGCGGALTMHSGDGRTSIRSQEYRAIP
jgi:hypothetical protein